MYSYFPKLAFKYDFSPANNMYVSITRGYRSGGYNVQMFSELIQSDMQQKMIEAILDKAPESMAGMNRRNDQATQCPTTEKN